MRSKFRAYRRTRPFWAAAWIILGGAVMFWLPLGPVNDVIRAGLGATGGVVLGLILVALGVLILIAPTQRKLGGICAIIVGLVSFPVTNLGGFGTCMLLALLGGSMAFAWSPDKSSGDRSTDLDPTVTPPITTGQVTS